MTNGFVLVQAVSNPSTLSPMNDRFRDHIVLGVGVAIAMIVSYWVGQQAFSWMPPVATTEAQKVDNLFSFLVSIGMFVFLGVAGMIGWAILTCRAERGDFSEAHPARGSVALEVLWLVGPTILVLWIAVQSQHIYELLNLEGLHAFAHAPTVAAAATAPKATSQQTIGITAKQWAWTFHYPGNITSDELHLPANQTTRLVMESEDVLHGFYVPAFRIKQDIIPNLKISLNINPLRAGKYRLQDSQFSGTYFALMKADVYVEPIAKYQSWLASSDRLDPILASNPAAIEHANPSNKLGARWPSIEPNVTSSFSAMGDKETGVLEEGQRRSTHPARWAPLS
jgi:cytochrome c oxidase subunit II